MTTRDTIRTYSELSKLKTFDERFEYLKLDGRVGEDTFGFDRYLNQVFYRSQRWKRVRDYVIVRDNGCDLGVEGYEIYKEPIIVHHMNPLLVEDIENDTEYLLDPEFLISTRGITHNALHYGTAATAPIRLVERSANDTSPWKRR